MRRPLPPVHARRDADLSTSPSPAPFFGVRPARPAARPTSTSSPGRRVLGRRWLGVGLATVLALVGGAFVVGGSPASADTSPEPVRVSLGGEEHAVDGVNVPRLLDNLIAYSSPPYRRTPTNQWGVEVTVVGGRVTAVNDRQRNQSQRRTKVPAGGYVLSGHNRSMDWLLAHVEVGQQVTLLSADGRVTDWPAGVTAAPVPAPTASGSASPSPSTTPSTSASASATVPPSATATVTPSVTPSVAPTVTPSATPSTTVGAASTGRWLSGASGDDQAAVDAYGAYRGERIGIAGTWDNGNDLQVSMDSICPGGSFDRWDRPLDDAVGAIDVRLGETWAAAAQGAYDARWLRHWQRTKQCWGTRDPGNFYARFAHEMNGDWMPWRVRAGEEADFVRALTRYSDLRYQVMPGARIVLSTSYGTSAGYADPRKLFPGKDSQGRPVVDVYTTDVYNNWPHQCTASGLDWKLTYTDGAGRPGGVEEHRRLAEQWGVPFGISEWSNAGDPNQPGGGGDCPEFVAALNDWLRANAGDPAHPQPGKVLYDVHFNLWQQYAFWPNTIQPRTAAEYARLSWG